MRLYEFTDQTTQIDNLVQQVIKFANGQCDEKTIASVVYDLLTKDGNRQKEAADKMQSGDPVFAQWRAWYKQFMQQLETYAPQQGWKSVSSGYWAHFVRQGSGTSNESRKLYLSLEPTTLGTELPKLFKLLRGLGSLVPEDITVQMKMPSVFGTLYSHRDSIVIHFSSGTATQAVQTAVQQSGLQTLDRSKFHRTDLGQDGRDADNIKTSDSQLIANRVVKSIAASKQQILQMTPDQLKGSLIQLIKNASMNASHRT
jgi:hypothetical protein